LTALHNYNARYVPGTPGHEHDGERDEDGEVIYDTNKGCLDGDYINPFYPISSQWIEFYTDECSCQRTKLYFSHWDIPAKFFTEEHPQVVENPVQIVKIVDHLQAVAWYSETAPA
jgi:hypothetical protein